MFEVYAVFDMPIARGDQAKAIFADLLDAQYFIETYRDESPMCIETWEVSNIDFMRA